MVRYTHHKTTEKNGTETKELLKEEQLRTPEEEIDVRLLLAKYRAVVEENRGLKEENTDLKEQLANCKKLIYGHKSEKTEVILENGEHMSESSYSDIETGETNCAGTLKATLLLSMQKEPGSFLSKVRSRIDEYLAAEVLPV